MPAGILRATGRICWLRTITRTRNGKGNWRKRRRKRPNYAVNWKRKRAGRPPARNRIPTETKPPARMTARKQKQGCRRPGTERLNSSRSPSGKIFRPRMTDLPISRRMSSCQEAVSRVILFPATFAAPIIRVFSFLSRQLCRYGNNGGEHPYFIGSQEFTRNILHKRIPFHRCLTTNRFTALSKQRGRPHKEEA